MPEKKTLIGLSLSQCTKEYIDNLIDFGEIKLIFAGTAIRTPNDIDTWIEHESKITRAIKADPELARQFVRTLFDRPGMLIQSKLLNNGMLPCYDGNHTWIHTDRWIDWNNYRTINQCCPYCGSINAYNTTNIRLDARRQINYKDLTCNNCYHTWTIASETQWLDWPTSLWTKGKIS